MNLMRIFILFLAVVSSFACLFETQRVCGDEPATTLTVTPASAVVSHPRFPQTILVDRQLPDGTRVDLTRKAQYRSRNPEIATVDEKGHVHPIAAGETVIDVEAEGLKAEVRITSQPLAEVPAYSYRDEIQPILSKARCNQGACHGYSLGKNGFKLSLRGADAEYDHFAITKEYFGRRVRGDEPERSLMLTKPAGDVPHQGGVRFTHKSDSYHRLSNWIREGASNDLGVNPTLEGIEVFPKYRVLPEPGSQQQLQVIARYADGSLRDVTALTIFTSGNEDYAEAGEDGLITMLVRGEVAVQVRYERVFTVANIVALDQTPGYVWSNPPERNFIDQQVFTKLHDLRVNPSELCSDEMFLRRVYLDMIGVQPTPEEVRAFLEDAAADKRDAVIESLFGRSEFVDHWSLKWGDLLQNSRRYMAEESMYAFRDWLRHAVASNMPLDAFAREVITAEGAVRDTAPAGFYRVSIDPNISLERTAQVFTGIRMLCARCHPHPFENWTQADYYGLASFFNQVGEKADFADPTDKIIMLNRQAGYATNPRTNQAQPPRYLGAGEPEIPAGVDRREVLANWLTSKENPLFARSLVNRFWSYFFSRGIIEPVDDIRVTNPPINPGLLDALTADFIAHDFDIRHLIRTITQSRVYQLSSIANASNEYDQDNFSHALPRRLAAEQLLDSVVIATGVAENIAGSPAGFRAAQAPDTNVTSEFLDLFGRAPRMEACECDRTTDTNMLQALHMINGNTLLQKVLAPNGRVATIAKNADLNPEQRVREIYVAALCRQPTPKEIEASLTYLESAPNPAEACQDLMWALLNSGDFLFVN